MFVSVVDKSSNAWLKRTIVICLSCIALHGQPSMPAPNDGELVLAFLRYHDFLLQETPVQPRADAETSASMKRAVADMVGLSLAESEKLSPAHAVMKSELTTIDREAAVYVQGLVANRGAANVKTLEQFEMRRLRVIQSGLQSLQGSLSPKGWASLLNYVNNTFRKYATDIRTVGK